MSALDEDAAMNWVFNNYFVEVLGVSTNWGDGENWQALVRGGARFMLGGCPDALPASELGDHSYLGFLATGDVDACIPSSQREPRSSSPPQPISHGVGGRWPWQLQKVIA